MKTYDAAPILESITLFVTENNHRGITLFVTENNHRGIKHENNHRGIKH